MYEQQDPRMAMIEALVAKENPSAPAMGTQPMQQMAGDVIPMPQRPGPTLQAPQPPSWMVRQPPMPQPSGQVVPYGELMKRMFPIPGSNQ